MDLSSLSWTQTLLVYVGIPAAIWLTIWFLWSLPAWRRQSSYHPGDAWLAEPEVIDSSPAAAGVPTSAAITASTDEAAPPAGGTSARW